MSMRKTKIDYLSNNSYSNNNNNTNSNKLKTKTKTFNLPSTYATTLNESNKLICSVLANDHHAGNDHHNLLGTADSAAVVAANNLNLPCPGCARIIHYPSSATAAKNGCLYGNCCGFRFSTSTVNYARPSRFVRHGLTKRTGPSSLSLSTKLSSGESIRKKHLNTQLMVRDKAMINNEQQNKKINPDQLDVSKIIYFKYLVKFGKIF